MAALDHLDLAISEFREMKMQPALERALKRKDIRGASVPVKGSNAPEGVVQ